MAKYLVFLRVFDGERQKEGYLAFGDVDHLFPEADVRRTPETFLFELEDIVPQVQLTDFGVREFRILDPKELTGPKIMTDAEAESLLLDDDSPDEYFTRR